MARLRSNLAGLLTQLVRDSANAELLAAESGLHLTLIGWLGVEQFEQEKKQILAARESARGSNKWSKVSKLAVTSKSALSSIHAIVESNAIRSDRAAFAERTIHVRHVAKKWLDEKTLCNRLAAQYGTVAGGVVRIRGPGDHGYIPEGEKTFHHHQSWAMVSSQSNPIQVAR